MVYYWFCVAMSLAINFWSRVYTRRGATPDVKISFFGDQNITIHVKLAYIASPVELYQTNDI